MACVQATVPNLQPDKYYAYVRALDAAADLPGRVAVRNSPSDARTGGTANQDGAGPSVSRNDGRGTKRSAPPTNDGDSPQAVPTPAKRGRTGAAPEGPKPSKPAKPVQASIVSFFTMKS